MYPECVCVGECITNSIAVIFILQCSDLCKADLQRRSKDKVILYRLDSLNDHLLSQVPFVEILTLLQEALQVRTISTIHVTGSRKTRLFAHTINL